jgi:hypothetical protein
MNGGAAICRSSAADQNACTNSKCMKSLPLG